jgi:hypothetical protein
VAGLPAAVGLSGDALHVSSSLELGFREAMLICSGLMVLAAAGSALLVDNDVLQPSPGERVATPECLTNCALGAPPLEPGPGEPGLPVRAAPRADSH